jgi:hypothetical protein
MTTTTPTAAEKAAAAVEALEALAQPDSLSKLGAIAKAEGEATLAKAALAKVQAELDLVKASLARAEAELAKPLPPRTTTLPAGIVAVTKAQDSAGAGAGASQAPSDDVIKAFLDAMSAEDRAMALTKMALKHPIPVGR